MSIPSSPAPVLALAALLAGATGAGSVASAAPADWPVPLFCRVNPFGAGRVIPPTLFGTNLEWFNAADGLAAPDGTVNPEWSRLARQEGVSVIRFPGGTLSDFYHWRDGIGPVSERPVREHPTDDGRSANVFGTDEFIDFCSAAGAQPLITVNAGTAEPAEAAAWVARCNPPGAKERVHFWEVGNELYLPGNPGDKRIITIPPDTYAERFLAFSSAMRTVDPRIRLIAIGTANATHFPLPYPKWTETLLRRAGGAMDALAVHYYFPVLLGGADPAVEAVYTNLVAAPDAVDRALNGLDLLLDRYEGARRIDIAVTEWGALFSLQPDWVDHVKTLGTAVYLARMLQVFLGQPRVTIANYFKFTDATMMGWVGYDGRPKAPYYVVELFARHFGSRLVPAAVDSPVHATAGVGIVPALESVADVTTVAARDEDGRLYVNLINRSWTTRYRVNVDTGRLRVAPDATAWWLSAPSPLDNDGPDLPPNIPRNLYVEPAGGLDRVNPVALVRREVNSADPVTLPPFSVVTLEFHVRRE